MDENEELEEEYVETLDDDSEYDNSTYNNYPQSHIRQSQKLPSNNDKNLVEKTGQATKNAGTVMKKTGAGIEKTGQEMQTAAKGVQRAGKGIQATGKGMQAAGKTASTTGDAIMTGAKAASATGVGAVAGIPIMAAGGVSKAVGTGTQIAGKGTEMSGQAMETSGQGLEKAGQGVEKAGAATKKAGEKLEKTGEKIEDSGKDLGKAKKKITETAKTVKFTKKHGIYIILVAVFLSLVLIFYQIMSPMIENMDNYNSFFQGFTNFVERSNNAYSGLGFKTTEEAFYDELDYQLSNGFGEIDLALVMSALMYAETTNDYTTDYAEVGQESDALDGLKAIAQDYSGASEYTQGQILRARMLCKGMLESTEGEKVTLGEFIKQYSSLISANKDRLDTALVGDLLSSDYIDAIKETYNLIQGPTFVTAKGNLFDALSDLLENITNGAKTLTGDIDVEFNLKDGKLVQIYVTMQVKKYSEDNFKNYLASYYIKNMPEFEPLIRGLTGTDLDSKIESIINEIYEHKIWYTEIYGNVEGSSEDYEETCVGAISSDLVSELGLPVKIDSDASISFDGEYAYGVSSARMHNGVDLNESTTGTKEGDKVLAIANGKVVDVVSDVSCNTESNATCDKNGSWVKLKHEITVEGTKYEFYSVYMYLAANSGQPKKGSKVKKGDAIGKVGKTGDTTIAQLHFEFHNEGDTPIDPTNLFVECTEGGLSGDSNEEKIWFYFRNQGFSEAATAGAMGNLMAESSLDSITVQGDYTQPDPDKYNRDYTNKVDNGKVSKYDFVNNGPGGGGYGLAQWTYSTRKKGLYEYMKKEKTSIGDLQMQLEYLNTEISGWLGGKQMTGVSASTAKQWKNVSNNISGVENAAKIYCRGFEGPEINNDNDRVKYAKEIYNRNKGKKAPSTSTVTSSGSNKIVDIAKSKLGSLYWWGKAGPDYFDCSGFVSWVYTQAGYDFGRLTTWGLYDLVGSGKATLIYKPSKNGTYDNKIINKLQKGDIFLFYEKNTHTGLYVGNGKMIDAGGGGSQTFGNNKNAKVRYSDVSPGSYYGNNIYAIIRIK